MRCVSEPQRRGTDWRRRHKWGKVPGRGPGESSAVKLSAPILTVLSKLLKVAVEWNELPHMPCLVRLVKTTVGTPTFWDFEQYARLIEAARQIDSTALVAILLGGDAGLRAGEMRALEWTDLDFVKRQIRVERSEWQGQVTTTKGNRVRYVPMTERLHRALHQHRHLKHARVLCEPGGTPMRANTLAAVVERATRKAGLATGRKPRHAGPHVLRHTFCSQLAMRGAPVRAVQELAGHRDLMTTQRYMHLTPATLEHAIRLLDQPASTTQEGAGREAELVEVAN